MLKTITAEKIRRFLNTTSTGHFHSKKPIELVRSDYLHGQTVILQGNSNEYEHPIEFWLACQAWCNEDETTFDDISAYESWIHDENRVGVCKTIEQRKQQQLETRLESLIPGFQSLDFLVMDPRWNNEKVLFSDGEDYYLYYWWTGE